MEYAVKEVLNQDVAGLVERVDEVIYEVSRSQSATVTDMRDFDRVRIDEYNAMLKRYATWISEAPNVDRPETHPRQYPIKYISESVNVDVENKSLRDLMRSYQALISEMSNSQSAKMGNGLTTHDKRRFDLEMTKIENFLTQYVDETQPLDMPESAPSSEAVEPGLTG